MVGGGSVKEGVMSTPPQVGQTDACENITFARFATRVVIKEAVSYSRIRCTTVTVMFFEKGVGYVVDSK